MKLKTVDVLARRYPIVWMDEDWTVDTNRVGQHQSAYNDYKIKLARMDRDAMGTLLHEIAHSLDEQLELFDRKNKGMIDAELFINIFVEQLHGVLRRNNINPLEKLEP